MAGPSHWPGPVPWVPNAKRNAPPLVNFCMRWCYGVGDPHVAVQVGDEARARGDQAASGSAGASSFSPSYAVSPPSTSVAAWRITGSSSDPVVT